MSLGANIQKAFDVVVKTHENVKKLMDFCIVKANEKGEFLPVSEKFLRWREENNPWSWSTHSVILLFQDTDDGDIDEMGWRDGPVYVMHINLYVDEDNEPVVNIAKFEYESMERRWGSSPADHWLYFDPLCAGEIDFTYENEIYTSEVLNPALVKRWHGLRRITGFEIPLTEITGENAYEKIFGGFHSLKEIGS